MKPSSQAPFLGRTTLGSSGVIELESDDDDNNNNAIFGGSPEKRARSASGGSSSATAAEGRRLSAWAADGSDDDSSVGGVSGDRGGAGDGGDVDSLLRALEVCSQLEPKVGGKKRPGQSRSAAAGGGVGGLRADEKAAAKAERAVAAAAAKEERERARLEASQAKKRQRDEMKAQEKAARERQRHGEQAARGKFADREIACIVERRLHDALPDVVRCAAGQDPLREQFAVESADYAIRGAVRWTHRGVLAGGATVAGDGVLELDFLVVVCRPDMLMPALAARGGPPSPASQPFGFPALGRIVDGIRGALPRRRRLVLVFHGLATEIALRWRRHGPNGAGSNGGGYGESGGNSGGGGGYGGGGCAPAVGPDTPHDAAAWLLVCAGVETRCTETDAELGEYLWDVTRGLARAPYADDVTPLSVVQRLKTVADGDDVGGGAASVWLRQLQMIPGVSEARARSLAVHYPSMRALVAALTDERTVVADRRNLLGDKLGGRTVQAALARKVFAFFTATDGDALLASSSSS